MSIVLKMLRCAVCCWWMTYLAPQIGKSTHFWKINIFTKTVELVISIQNLWICAVNREILKNVIKIHVRFLRGRGAWTPWPVNNEPLNTFGTLELLFPITFQNSSFLFPSNLQNSSLFRSEMNRSFMKLACHFPVFTYTYYLVNVILFNKPYKPNKPRRLMNGILFIKLYF